MKAYSNTPEGFNIVFPNGMTVSVTWYRKTTSDGGHTSAEVIVHKDNVRYEYEEGLWREGEGLDEWNTRYHLWSNGKELTATLNHVS